MAGSVIIKNANVVNEGKIFSSDVFIKDGLIEKIGTAISVKENCRTIYADDLHLLPGVIDSHVHFREPGVTDKGDIYTESRAAVAGGVTSFMDMPNTIPNTLTQELLEEKYRIASQKSLANYSFYIGASNTNLDEILKTDPKTVCGIKVFMGSSTGNMLVDDEKTLENIFSQAPLLIATHCEDEAMIRENLEKTKLQYKGKSMPPFIHWMIRDEKACYKSSSNAVELAKKHNTRLHVLHISTAIEIPLFDNSIPLEKKRITAEACIPYLFFSSADQEKWKNYLKCNPSLKFRENKEALRKALNENHLDTVASDHAPHLKKEKRQNYEKAPSGIPSVQYGLTAMLEWNLETPIINRSTAIFKRETITLEKIVEKMCHAPAVCFNIAKRGYIREGYHADLVLADLKYQSKLKTMNEESVVKPANILSRCGWSPFEGEKFEASVTHTFVNGNLVYENGKFFEKIKGQRLSFDR